MKKKTTTLRVLNLTAHAGDQHLWRHREGCWLWWQDPQPAVCSTISDQLVSLFFSCFKQHKSKCIFLMAGGSERRDKHSILWQFLVFFAVNHAWMGQCTAWNENKRWKWMHYLSISSCLNRLKGKWSQFFVCFSSVQAGQCCLGCVTRSHLEDLASSIKM